MKLTISFDELKQFDFDYKVDISNYFELVKEALEYRFPEWDFEMAFNPKTLEYDESNKEVSIDFRM